VEYDVGVLNRDVQVSIIDLTGNRAGGHAAAGLGSGLREESAGRNQH